MTLWSDKGVIDPTAYVKKHLGFEFDRALVRRAWLDAVVKLDPRHMVHNSVMFVVEVVSLLAAYFWIKGIAQSSTATNVFAGLVVLWLFVTVLFANFAEAVAQGRGKARADALRRTRTDTMARVRRSGEFVLVHSMDLRTGDICEVEAGEVIPGDGEIVEGIATVDESAITGESEPVIREAGGDCSAVTGGTKVLSDKIIVVISANPGETFLDRMIALVEGASRQKTPNEVALDILLAGLTLVFVMAITTLQPFAVYSHDPQPIIVLVALFVCLIPTTIGALLSAIGIAGMDRLVQRNILAMDGHAVEAAGDCSTLLLDKTGTITYGNRKAAQLIPMPGVSMITLAQAAMQASLADETPEGRSIVDLVTGEFSLQPHPLDGAVLVPFSAQSRMSGVDVGGRQMRKGAGSAVIEWVEGHGVVVPRQLHVIIDGISTRGGTPLVVAESDQVLGVVYLKDVIKPGMKERFDQLRKMGIRTVMITGDNPLTAAAIAHEAGVDDFLAEATPEHKMALIKQAQEGGHLVAMSGDGTNDAPALAVADVGVAMNTGTQAAKEAANMVDLDSNPTKIIEIVEIGKQLLITRGSLTTFSITNDIAKFFAIVPAMFVVSFPRLSALNIMKLSTPHSAILSAVIFNALIIVALIPLALRGVRYRALGAAGILRRNLLIFGAGGLIVPFVGIKLIDMMVTAMGIH